jgi:hypothetical protein
MADDTVPNQDGWTVHESVGDHSFVGTTVVVERTEDGELVEREGVIDAIWEFPAQRAHCSARRRRARGGRRDQHGGRPDPVRMTSVRHAVVRADGTPHRYNAAVSRRAVNTTGQHTPAAIWRESTRRHRTLPLFSRGQYKRSPVEESHPWTGRSPRRAARGQHAMTRRRATTTREGIRCIVRGPNDRCYSRGFFSLNEILLMWVGGAPAPPAGGVAARYLPNRQARPVQSTGGRPEGWPPASQHDAVCGGGSTPHPHSMMLCGRPGGRWS